MSLEIEVQEKIFNLIRLLPEEPLSEISLETPLIGDGSVLDSMKLVELCVSLEDLASDLSFEFDWTSDVAMSRSRSMFRTAGSLVQEFLNQWNDKK